MGIQFKQLSVVSESYSGVYGVLNSQTNSCIRNCYVNNGTGIVNLTNNSHSYLMNNNENFDSITEYINNGDTSVGSNTETEYENWSSTKKYSKGDIVYRGSILFICNKENTNIDPISTGNEDNTYWSETENTTTVHLSNYGINGALCYNSSLSVDSSMTNLYQDVIFDTGSVYNFPCSDKAIPLIGLLGKNNELINQYFVKRNIYDKWVNNRIYNQGSIVTFNNVNYMCMFNNIINISPTSEESVVKSIWVKINEGMYIHSDFVDLITTPTYNYNRIYYYQDVMEYNGVIYFCNNKEGYIATDSSTNPINSGSWIVDSRVDTTFLNIYQQYPALFINDGVKTLYNSQSLLLEDYTYEIRNFIDVDIFQTHVPRNLNGHKLTVKIYGRSLCDAINKTIFYAPNGNKSYSLFHSSDKNHYFFDNNMITNGNYSNIGDEPSITYPKLTPSSSRGTIARFNISNFYNGDIDIVFVYETSTIDINNKYGTGSYSNHKLLINDNILSVDSNTTNNNYLIENIPCSFVFSNIQGKLTIYGTDSTGKSGYKHIALNVMKSSGYIFRFVNCGDVEINQCHFDMSLFDYNSVSIDPNNINFNVNQYFEGMISFDNSRAVLNECSYNLYPIADGQYLQEYQSRTLNVIRSGNSVDDYNVLWDLVYPQRYSNMIFNVIVEGLVVAENNSQVLVNNYTLTKFNNCITGAAINGLASNYVSVLTNSQVTWDAIGWFESVPTCQTMVDYLDDYFKMNNYDGNATYVVDDKVKYTTESGVKRYICIKDNGGSNKQLPTNSEYWAEYFNINTGLFITYDNDTEYKTGDQVVYNGKFYRCIKDISGKQLPTDTEYWVTVLSGWDQETSVSDAIFLNDLTGKIIKYSTWKRILEYFIDDTGKTVQTISVNNLYYYIKLWLNDLEFISGVEGGYASTVMDLIKTLEQDVGIRNTAEEEKNLSDYRDSDYYAFDQNKRYSSGNVVYYNFKYYVCIKNMDSSLSVAPAPPNAEYWKLSDDDNYDSENLFGKIRQLIDYFTDGNETIGSVDQSLIFLNSASYDVNAGKKPVSILNGSLEIYQTLIKKVCDVYQLPVPTFDLNNIVLISDADKEKQLYSLTVNFKGTKSNTDIIGRSIVNSLSQNFSMDSTGAGYDYQITQVPLDFACSWAPNINIVTDTERQQGLWDRNVKITMNYTPLNAADLDSTNITNDTECIIRMRFIAPIYLYKWLSFFKDIDRLNWTCATFSSITNAMLELFGVDYTPESGGSAKVFSNGYPGRENVYYMLWYFLYNANNFTDLQVAQFVNMIGILLSTVSNVSGSLLNHIHVLPQLTTKTDMPSTGVGLYTRTYLNHEMEPLTTIPTANLLSSLHSQYMYCDGRVDFNNTLQTDLFNVLVTNNGKSPNLNIIDYITHRPRMQFSIESYSGPSPSDRGYSRYNATINIISRGSAIVNEGDVRISYIGESKDVTLHECILHISGTINNNLRSGLSNYGFGQSRAVGPEIMDKLDYYLYYTASSGGLQKVKLTGGYQRVALYSGFTNSVVRTFTNFYIGDSEGNQVQELRFQNVGGGQNITEARSGRYGCDATPRRQTGYYGGMMAIGTEVLFITRIGGISKAKTMLSNTLLSQGYNRQLIQTFEPNYYYILYNDDNSIYKFTFDSQQLVEPYVIANQQLYDSIDLNILNKVVIETIDNKDIAYSVYRLNDNVAEIDSQLVKKYIMYLLTRYDMLVAQNVFSNENRYQGYVITIGDQQYWNIPVGISTHDVGNNSTDSLIILLDENMQSVEYDLIKPISYDFNDYVFNTSVFNKFDYDNIPTSIKKQIKYIKYNQYIPADGLTSDSVKLLNTLSELYDNQHTTESSYKVEIEYQSGNKLWFYIGGNNDNVQSVVYKPSTNNNYIIENVMKVQTKDVTNFIKQINQIKLDKYSNNNLNTPIQIYNQLVEQFNLLTEYVMDVNIFNQINDKLSELNV